MPKYHYVHTCNHQQPIIFYMYHYQIHLSLYAAIVCTEWPQRLSAENCWIKVNINKSTLFMKPNVSTSYDFNQETLLEDRATKGLQPINNMSAPHPKSPLTSANFGDYEPYKIGNFLFQENKDESTDRTDDFDPEGELIKIVQMDSNPDSDAYAHITSDFDSLIIKYASYDLSFIGVTGPKGAGKSFFCDRILNLAQIKGNHYSNSQGPGLFCWSKPFIKDKVCIFFVQIANCQQNSAPFKVLHTLGLLIFSSIIYIHSPSEKAHANSFQIYEDETLDIIEGVFDFTGSFDEENSDVPDFTKFFPKFLFKLTRNQKDVKKQLSLSPFFLYQYHKYLPNAKAQTFLGTDEDLKSFSFLATACISASYVRCVYETFKKIFSCAGQKKMGKLSINGTTASKMASAAVRQLNEGIKIKIVQIYENIISELYASAFNYCVMKYHDELQAYFSDQKAKNSEEMYRVFERASDAAYINLNEFKLHEDFHEEYQRKLQTHIEMKECMLMDINKDKSIQQLSQAFKQSIVFPYSHSNLDQLKQLCPSLNVGRQEIVGQYIQLILNDLEQNRNKGQNEEKIKNLKKQIKDKQNQLSKSVKQKKQGQKNVQKQKTILQNENLLKKKIESQIKQMSKEVEKVKKQNKDKKVKKDEENKRYDECMKKLEEVRKKKKESENVLEQESREQEEHLARLKVEQAKKKQQIDNLIEGQKKIKDYIDKAKEALVKNQST